MASNTPSGQALRRHRRDKKRLDKSGDRGVTSKSVERKIKAAEKAGNVKSWKALRAKQKHRDNPEAAEIRARAAGRKARKKGIKQGHIVHKPGVLRGLTASYHPMYSAYLDFLQEAKKKKGFRPAGMRKRRLDIGRANLAGKSPTGGRLQKMASTKVTENIMAALKRRKSSDDDDAPTGTSRAKASASRAQGMKFRQMQKKSASKARIPTSHAWTGRMQDHIVTDPGFRHLILVELKTVMGAKFPTSRGPKVSLRGAGEYIKQRYQRGRAEGEAARHKLGRKVTKGIGTLGQAAGRLVQFIGSRGKQKPGGTITDKLKKDTPTPPSPGGQRADPLRLRQLQKQARERREKKASTGGSSSEHPGQQKLDFAARRKKTADVLARANQTLAKSRATRASSAADREKADVAAKKFDTAKSGGPVRVQRKIAGRVLSARARKGKGSTNIRLGGTAFKK